MRISAVAHGNGPNGLAIVMVAFNALARLDQEHAAVYFQLVYNALREPMQVALEKLIMERQTQENPTFPPFARKLIERGELEGKREGKREALLRLMARMGIALTEEERARIHACTDVATLDRWFDNAFGSKTAAEVLT